MGTKKKVEAKQPKEKVAEAPEKKESKEIAVLKNSSSAEVLIAQAIDKNVSVETMEKLLAMRRELKAEHAKEEFDYAMSKFQEECPVVKKSSEVKEKTGDKVRYRYASLDVIVEQVKEYIAKNGLSYSLNVKQDDKMLTVICRVKHLAGHSEESQFSIPIGSEQYMSEVQKYGARVTFAKRYAFCNAFGIMTGDEDNDATTVEDTPKTAYTPRPAYQAPAAQPAQPAKPTVSNPGAPASAAQKSLIRNLLNDLARDEQWLLKNKGLTQFKSVDEMTMGPASQAIEALKGFKAKQGPKDTDEHGKPLPVIQQDETISDEEMKKDPMYKALGGEADNSGIKDAEIVGNVNTRTGEVIEPKRTW